jgi:hypothetical protein
VKELNLRKQDNKTEKNDLHLSPKVLNQLVSGNDAKGLLENQEEEKKDLTMTEDEAYDFNDQPNNYKIDFKFQTRKSGTTNVTKPIKNK